jgi:hypothetical protein
MEPSSKRDVKDRNVMLPNSIRSLALIAMVTLPSLSYAQDVTFWRDPAQGCTYIVTPQGGATLRYKRDGTPDCIPPSQMQSQTPAAPAPFINPALQVGRAQANPALTATSMGPGTARVY